MDRAQILIAIMKCAVIALTIYAILRGDITWMQNYFADTPHQLPSFVGDHHWFKEERALCDNEDEDITWMMPDAVCYQIRRGYSWSKIEIRSWSPPLVIYHSMFTDRQVTDYLRIFRNMQLHEEKVGDETGSSYFSDFRRANGSATELDRFPEAKSLSDTAATMIPALDFNIAEPPLGLSYAPGGHYATHYDYFTLEKGKTEDWMPIYGNRLATLLMVFEMPKVGGGTMFPSLATTVKAKPGDAILFFNSRKDMSQEEKGDHAGCPVYDGRKIISTIWLRSYGQPLHLEFFEEESFDASVLLR